MSVTATAKRRRRQYANGFKHLARLCGKAVRGGRPIYPGASGLSVQQAIARERELARRQAAVKATKRSK